MQFLISFFSSTVGVHLVALLSGALADPTLIPAIEELLLQLSALGMRLPKNTLVFKACVVVHNYISSVAPTLPDPVSAKGTGVSMVLNTIVSAFGSLLHFASEFPAIENEIQMILIQATSLGMRLPPNTIVFKACTEAHAILTATALVQK